jgi:hypothetical protein
MKILWHLRYMEDLLGETQENNDTLHKAKQEYNTRHLSLLWIMPKKLTILEVVHVQYK